MRFEGVRTTGIYCRDGCAGRPHPARRLLDETDLPMPALSRAAGFASTRQMNRVIKDTFRFTPAELRRRRSRTGGLRADGGLRLPGRRVDTIHAFSTAVADGSLDLRSGAPLDELTATLEALPGTGHRALAAQYLWASLREEEA